MTDSALSDTAEPLTRTHAAEADVGLHLYDRFADRIHDFVLFLTRDGVMAAETTRDVIVMTAHQDPLVLSDPESLRAWLYARARDETFALLSTRGRTPPADRVVEVQGLPDLPTTADLGSLVWTAMAAFSERDQALVTLHLRHGLERDALADAMGLSPAAVDVLLPTTLERVESQIAALLALATDQLPADCPDLQAVHADWDGMFSPLVRGRVAQMLLDSGTTCPASGPGPMALLQTIPLCPAPASLRDAVGERLAMASRLGAGNVAVDSEIDDTLPPEDREPVDPAVTVAVDDAGMTEGGLDVAAQVAGVLPQEELVQTTVPVVNADPPPAVAPAAALPAAEDVVHGHMLSASGEPPDAPPVVKRGGDDADASPGAVSVAGAETGGGLPGVATATTVAPAGPEVVALRTPLPLAMALGVAVGLVIAAALFRVMSGDVAPEQVSEVVSTIPSPVVSAGALADVVDPVSATAGVSLSSSAEPKPIETPGRLSVPGEEVVVVPDGQTALRLTNSGGVALDWHVVSQPRWAVLDQTQGSVDPGATVEIQVTLAAALAEGDRVGNVIFGWDAPEPSITTARLTGAVEQAPELQNVRVGSRLLAAQGCGLEQTEIEVMVADESPIVEVMVTATGPGPETQTQFALAADPTQPGRFVGVLGPFDASGSALLEIEATDQRGNRAAAGGGELAVTPCAGG